MATAMHIKREKTALIAAFKDMKRPDLQALCKTHDIKGTNRAKNLLEASLAEHCIAEHTGRVVNLGRCDGKGSGLTASCSGSSSSAIKPLAPIRRGIERTASAPMPASVPSNIPSLQSQLEELRAQIASLQAGPSEARIVELIESRLEEQRQTFISEISELQNLCEVGFANVQASFESVAEWRGEVTSAFENIQSWAKEVEQKVLSGDDSAAKAQRPQPASVIPRPSISTPVHSFSHQPSFSQTPAGPQAYGILGRKRLSDATERSLAAIPEAATTPSSPAVQETEQAEEVPERAEKRVRIDKPEPSMTSDPAAPPGQHDSFQLDIALPQSSVVPRPRFTSTPAATKTLFGTELSTEQRFGDLPLADISVNTPVEEGMPALPSWTAGSPCWTRKAAAL